jgi:hypothetical protein
MIGRPLPGPLSLFDSVARVGLIDRSIREIISLPDAICTFVAIGS